MTDYERDCALEECRQERECAEENIRLLKEQNTLLKLLVEKERQSRLAPGEQEAIKEGE